MTKIESGKLGGAKTAQVNRKKKEETIKHYNALPNKCSACSTSLPYNKRMNKYCSSSCSAKITNLLPKQRKKREYTCLECNQFKLTKPSDERMFCSRRCSTSFNTRTVTYVKIENGEVSERSTLKKYLVSKYGYHCQCCGISDWMGSKITLELDHIDGDPSNNFPQNLRLLCPNCHSITPTWKGKNKGKGRKSRNLPLN